MQSMHADMVQAMQTGSAMARMDAHIKAMESMVESLKALKPSTEPFMRCSPTSKSRRPINCWAAVAA